MSILKRAGIAGFLANENKIHFHLQKPWLENGEVIATNDHVLIAYAKAPEGVTAEDRTPYHPENIAKMFAEAPQDGFAPLPQLPDFMPCSDCEGNGTVYWRWDEDVDGFEFKVQTDSPEICDACDGYGERRHRFEIADGVGFQLRYLRLLSTLPGVEFAHGGPEKMAAFRFDGGHGLLMPMRNVKWVSL